MEAFPETPGLARASPVEKVRRSPMEMACDILGVLYEGPAKPTHLLYRANMSWRVLSEYLDYLQKGGMVEKEVQGEKRATYRLTQRGRAVYGLYADLRMSLTEKMNFTPGVHAPELLARVPTAERRSSTWPWT